MQPWIMIQTGMVTGWEDKMNIREELGKRMLFFDGGLGSLLQARGLKPGELPETWNLSKPEELLAIHKEYLEAGATLFLPIPSEPTALNMIICRRSWKQR